MRKVNLLKQAPKIKRNVSPIWRGQKNRIIAREFGKEFFDGDRINGYGGYKYDGRWRNVVKKLQKIYGINSKSSVLDIGCAKGFLVYDLKDLIPGINVRGVDISKYALNHAMDGFGNYTSQKIGGNSKELENTVRKNIRPFLINRSADDLHWPNNSFDFVLSINTTHNLPKEKCKKALGEMTRVCKTNKMFIQVDAYRTERERQAITNWNLTAQTILHVDDWLSLFKEVGYQGDYFWTILDFEN